MIVLTESSGQLPPSSSARDIAACTHAAELTGCSVYRIPQDFTECEDAEGALYYVPAQESERPGVWIGYIPSLDRYSAIYDAALAKGIRLLNSPAEHQRAQEFDSAYLHLVGITPESIILSALEECDAAVQTLGLPVFVKGAVQSRKARGWKACVAETHEELQRLVSALLTLENRSRGRVVIRKLVQLRYARMSAQGFPFGREYRVFVYDGKILEMGYYWEGDDPLKKLTSSEENHVRALALDAWQRLQVPYLAVDIGQLQDGSWIVIETGDPQFSGVSTIPVLRLWNRIAQIGSSIR